MTDQDLGKSKDEEIARLQTELAVYDNLRALKDEASYRYQTLLLLERVALALEEGAMNSKRQAEALEASLQGLEEEGKK